MGTIVFVLTSASTAHTDCAEEEQHFFFFLTCVVYFDTTTVWTAVRTPCKKNNTLKFGLMRPLDSSRRTVPSFLSRVSKDILGPFLFAMRQKVENKSRTRLIKKEKNGLGRHPRKLAERHFFTTPLSTTGSCCEQVESGRTHPVVSVPRTMKICSFEVPPLLHLSDRLKGNFSSVLVTLL